jgi:hypothetical protein
VAKFSKPLQLKSKLELVKKEQELIKKRKIPEWNGVNFIDNKKQR